MAIIGIDLGTTNSLVAYWNNNEPALIPNAFGEYLTPSAVGHNDNNDILIGKTAIERLRTHPKLTTANFKRYMGTNKTIMLGETKYRPEELSALVLKSLKEDAEHFLDETVTDAIISVPAYFNDTQRNATKIAGTLAGLNVEHLINEPTAAAISYGLHIKDDANTFLVLDLGGGTFDVSILEVFDGVMQVHASTGDNFLGGEDFLHKFAKQIASKNDIDLKKLSDSELNSFYSIIKHCIHQLSTKVNANIKSTIAGKDIEYETTRNEFEQCVSPLILRLRSPIERAIKDTGLQINELDSIILVGGASRMPLVRSLAAKMLGQIPLAKIDPDKVVALGTAIQTGLVQDNVHLKEIVLTDVAPYTLGTDIINRHSTNPDDSLFHPIIERNSPIPISRVDTLYTAHDFQEKMVFDIYQGESRLVKDNIKLGGVTVPVPKDKKGEQSADIRFTYDANGLLEVEIKVTQTNHYERLVIEGNPGSMTPEEIETRLKELSKLKIHPRDKAENTHLLAKGERLFAESLGETRTYIRNLLSQFEETLNRQDETEIENLRIQITEIFDSLDEY